jgi:hypothetical protein
MCAEGTSKRPALCGPLLLGPPFLATCAPVRGRLLHHAAIALKTINLYLKIVLMRTARCSAAHKEAAMAKSAAWGTLHLGIGFGVGCGISGSLAVAGALAVVEPLCNTVPHGFFDR